MKIPTQSPDRQSSGFKYPSEDEVYVRRLGSALLVHWEELPEEMRQKILLEAAQVWDREYHIPQIARKLDTFVRRVQASAR